VQLENFAADHALPTGGYGFPRPAATVELLSIVPGAPWDA